MAFSVIWLNSCVFCYKSSVLLFLYVSISKNNGKHCYCTACRGTFVLYPKRNDYCKFSLNAIRKHRYVPCGVFLFVMFGTAVCGAATARCTAIGVKKCKE